MTDDRDDRDRDRAGYQWQDCFVCGGRLRLSDPCADRLVREDGDAKVARGHRACLAEGVARWNRLNRPYDSPLEASRRDGWSWHDDPPQRITVPD